MGFTWTRLVLIIPKSNNLSHFHISISSTSFGSSFFICGVDVKVCMSSSPFLFSLNMRPPLSSFPIISLMLFILSPSFYHIRNSKSSSSSRLRLLSKEIVARSFAETTSPSFHNIMNLPVKCSSFNFWTTSSFKMENTLLPSNVFSFIMIDSSDSIF